MCCLTLEDYLLTLLECLLYVMYSIENVEA